MEMRRSRRSETWEEGMALLMAVNPTMSEKKTETQSREIGWRRWPSNIAVAIGVGNALWIALHTRDVSFATSPIGNTVQTGR